MTADEVKKGLDAFRKTSPGYFDVQRLMMRYGFECFFRRLAASKYRDVFVLKGAMLLALLGEHAHRNTKDSDFQVHGHHNSKSLASLFMEICSIAQDDGLHFQLDSIAINDAGKEREYPGFVVMVKASLGNSPLNLTFDIGFGEVITPTTRIIEIPTLLNMPKPKLRAYPWETVVAEKFEALVKLGMRNNRMKDFFDLAMLAQAQTFEGAVLAEAIQKTFSHRNTALPNETPLALTDAFFKSKAKLDDWKAFLTRHSLPNSKRLDACCKVIEHFLMPLVRAINASEAWEPYWDGSEWKGKL